jgi:hypothetical protein
MSRPRLPPYFQLRILARNGVEIGEEVVGDTDAGLRFRAVVLREDFNNASAFTCCPSGNAPCLRVIEVASWDCAPQLPAFTFWS